VFAALESWLVQLLRSAAPAVTSTATARMGLEVTTLYCDLDENDCQSRLDQLMFEGERRGRRAAGNAEFGEDI
jgi:hypothetical protein